MGFYIQVAQKTDLNIEKLQDRPISFNGTLRESKEFINILDYGLNLLSMENLELKGEMLGLIIKKSRTLEKLMELGTKHAVQSSLYDLEQEGFITRKIRNEKETNVYYYVFNRSKLLFKIQKDLETNYEKMKEKMEFYSSNYLFYCGHCKKLFEYAEAMENAFRCCQAQMKSFDASEIVQKITENMAYLQSKLNSLSVL